MLLSEIFDELNYSELATLALGDGDEEGILPENYEVVTNYINRGLLELHKRFDISEKEAILKLDSTIKEYFLKPEHGISAGTAINKYIVDTVDNPFNDTVLRINQVEKRDKEERIIYDLNNEQDDECIIKTIGHLGLYIEKPENNKLLRVKYRAAPNRIIYDANNFDPETIEINLPYSLLAPLTYYVGMRAHSGIPALDGQQAESSIYAQKYENSLINISDNGLVEDHALINNRLENNGWR